MIIFQSLEARLFKEEDYVTHALHKGLVERRTGEAEALKVM